MIGKRWCARLLGILIALACTLQTTTAVASDELAVDIASLDADEPTEVVAVVSVVDDSGRPVLGLTEENFVARIEGSPVSIDRVTPAVNSDIGVAVVLAVDVSGSMEGDPLVQAQGAARSFVEGLAPLDSVALVTFGDEAAPVLSFGADKDAVVAALDGLQAAGDTALYQATSASVYVAASAQTERKAVILLSDGVDFGNRSTVSREESLAHAAALGVPFFTVGLGTNIDRAYLEALAQGTGGRFLETPTPQGLSELYRAIGDFLRAQYAISLSPGPLAREQPSTLEIEVTQGQTSGLAREVLPALEAPSVIAEAPVVAVQGLVPGAELEAPVTLTVKVTGELPLETVRVKVDGSLAAQLVSPPYEVSLDPAAYAIGNHVLRVEAVDAAGGVGATEMSFVAATPASGGLSFGLLTTGVVLLLLAAAGSVGLLAIVRRRPEATVVAGRIRPWSPRRYGEPETWQPPPSELPTLGDEPLGRLIVAAGPRQGETLEVGARPLRIGSAPHCDLVLTDEEGSIAPEEARVWVSESRLMYHKLARLTAFASDNPTTGWFVLQNGDEIAVGSHRLVFELLGRDDGVAEALAQLERTNAGRPEDRSEETARPQAAAEAREEGEQTPEPAPADEAGTDAGSE